MKNVILGLPIQLGVIEVSGIRVAENAAVFAELRRCGQAYQAQYSGRPISEIPGVQNARQLFRALGIEPTKHRPSSEAMLRRFLKGKEAYSVNNVVDVSNWCALDFLLPNGVYDRSKIVGDIELRKGMPGEFYIGLNNLEVHLEDRYALADDIGPFGSPKTDSQRSCVDAASTSVIAVVYAPIDYDLDKLNRQCERYAQRFGEYCGGSVDTCRIVDHSI